ncbi:histidinol-phosphatase HisJ [Clostridium sp. D53t1_180928_C8]|uniref:histidinol-phosphatase HisJ n=1 Tax=Clostridium sp. D53t1_180928_C8 TaxID=2787101 RepID=UPI0018A961BB
MNKGRDGHVHSHYCPHGSNDSFEMYLENAINKGICEITFTEHMTMPEDIVIEGMENNFLDSVSPSIENIDKYINEVRYYKEKYKGKIKINVGLEVDYLEGYEEFTKKLLNKYGDILEDSILSTHIGKYKERYYCFDCIESFEVLLKEIGSIEKLYDLYYNTLLKSIKCNLGKFKPKRIGHPTLVRIFNKKYPINYSNVELFKKIMDELNKRNYELDYNTAGLRKIFCGEIYPSGEFFEMAIINNVKMVYGSDSHVASDIGFNFK